MTLSTAQCEWPKSCNAGVYAEIDEQHDDNEDDWNSMGLCEHHFLEWLGNLAWRDEVTAASFIVESAGEHSRFELVTSGDDEE